MSTGVRQVLLDSLRAEGFFGTTMGFSVVALQLEIAYDKHWLYLRLETDSVYVVNIFKRHTSLVPWRLLDRLSRESVDSFEWWSTIPDFLTPFLNRDRSVEFYRFSM
ncbi:hypothetical protein ACS0TY_030549 [Phlomoides rotata]